MQLAIFALFIGAAAALRTQSTGFNVASKLKEDLNAQLGQNLSSSTEASRSVGALKKSIKALSVAKTFINPGGWWAEAYIPTLTADPLTAECNKQNCDHEGIGSCAHVVRKRGGGICYPNGKYEEGYRGCQDKTVTGKNCQKWTVQSPQKHTRTPSNYPSSGLGNHNYCRNPDGEDGIWCYTTDSSTRWERCESKQCETTGVKYEKIKLTNEMGPLSKDQKCAETYDIVKGYWIYHQYSAISDAYLLKASDGSEEYKSWRGMLEAKGQGYQGLSDGWWAKRHRAHAAQLIASGHGCKWASGRYGHGGSMDPFLL